jgi:hypothetical protein
MFSDNFFSDISEAFNNTKIGVMFNSYNPVAGIEYIHMNLAAKDALNRKYNKKCSYRAQTEYKKITPDSVRCGLWLYQYGFEGTAGTLDGAYYRQVILSELAPAGRIFVARPLNRKWIGELPTNLIGLEDLKTETSFNGSYAGERDKILLINKLVKDGELNPEKYHEIVLEEIEVKTQEGFFDYVFEDRSLFDRAREEANDRFRRL